MKVAFPLSLKVALWLLLNLAVLAIAGTLFVAVNYGLGWEPLLDSEAGGRVRRLATEVNAELRADPAQALDPLLARLRPDPAAELYLFLNDGTQLGGPVVTLPAEIRDELDRRPRSGPPPPADGERRLRPPPPPLLEEAPGGGDPAPARFGFVRSAGAPPAYWIALRLPVPRADRLQPERGTLFVRVPSTLAMLRLLDFGTWLLVLAAGFVLSVLCWLPLVALLRRDLLAVTRATEEIAEGGFATRLATVRRDELGVLSGAVNRMAERLELQAQEQKRFLADLAHELGSPLARLQLAVELLERRIPAGDAAFLTDVRDEVSHVTVLVNELLAFTRAGLRPRDAKLGAVDLAALASLTLTREGAGARGYVEMPAGLRARADAELLGRALANLVRNALRYAPESIVAVQAERDRDEVVLRVFDEGPGVPEDALARLGEPFYRPDEARGRETGGTGLGLAIVRASVNASQGRLSFRNRAPQGFEAEIRLAAE